MNRASSEHAGHAHAHGAHEHSSGPRAWLHRLFVPHSHDVSDTVGGALEASSQGIRAVQLSLAGLGATAILQLIVVLVSGSVALLADTVHNFSDALTAVPLWIAFVLGRRKPTRRFTHGFGRAEDLAGLFVLAMIAVSAVLAGYESIHRIVEPRPLDNLGWVLAAGVVGFAGNELVAVYRIRVGRRIGSAALVADGVHARTDGFTSLGVVAGGIGVLLGFPLADPIIGLLITVAIAVLLVGTARDVGRRLLDGVDPQLVEQVEHAVARVTDTEIDTLRLRWSGHRLHVTASIRARDDTTIERFRGTACAAEYAIKQAVPTVATVTISPAKARRRVHPGP